MDFPLPLVPTSAQLVPAGMFKDRPCRHVTPQSCYELPGSHVHWPRTLI